MQISFSLWNIFRFPISVEDYIHHFPHIDPLAPHKPWLTEFGSLKPNKDENLTRCVKKFPVEAVFVVSDPVDWSRDLQVIFF